MLVIFDCDGTLVDSEIIWSEATVDVFKEEDLDMSVEDISSTYAGMTNVEIIAKIEADLGRNLPFDIIKRIEARAEKMLKKLQVIEGAHEMLDQLDYARCVCSNTNSDKLEANMRLTGLWDRFRPYVYSAQEVGTKAPKPDPNVFLHAATVLDTDPEVCFVIEDSVHGVQAAVQAGMRVIGFTGASHSYVGHGEHLMDGGAETVINRLSDLPATLEALKEWREH